MSPISAPRWACLIAAGALGFIAGCGKVIGVQAGQDASGATSTSSHVEFEPDDVRGRELCGEWLQREIDRKVANSATNAQGLERWKPDWVLVAGYDSTVDEAVAWSEAYLLKLLGEDSRRDEVTGRGRRLVERSAGLEDRYAAVCWIRGTFLTYLESTVIVLPNGDHASVVADTYLRPPVRPSVAASDGPATS